MIPLKLLPIIGILTLSILLLGCVTPETNNDSANMDDTNNPADENDLDEPKPMYTLAQVAAHDSREDCWLAIDGKVYDVTGFIASGNHGGGDAILEGCGKDATELFNTRPMGSNTPHSERARGFLPNFYIGDLTV